MERLKGIHFDVVLDVTAYDEKDITDLIQALDLYDQYIMISSSAVYPESNVQPFVEESQLGENIYWEKYGTDKIEAERKFLDLVPKAFIIRPPYLYGPMNNVYREASLCIDKQIMPETISLEDGLREAYEWYCNNSNEVMKKTSLNLLIRI